MRLFCLILSSLVSLTVLAQADDQNRAGKILTVDLAQKILGSPPESKAMPATPDTEIGKTWVSRISYSSKAGGAASTRISLLIRHGDSGDQAKGIFESSKATFKGVDVVGLGDAAYRTQTPAQLDILKGQNWLIISAGTLRDPDPALQEKAAREILAKLP